MAGARDHLDPYADQATAAVPRRASDRAHGPAIAGPADPRLAHGDAAPGLLALQRTAGNAAVSSLVAPVVQREVRIDEMESTVSGPATGPAAPGAAGGASDGAAAATGPTTITGSQITLDAPITESPGVIRADTVIANSVVAANYTPGAGNVW